MKIDLQPNEKEREGEGNEFENETSIRPKIEDLQQDKGTH